MEKATAILLRKTPLTETSLIIHWSTEEHGLLKTVARGARSPKSAFAGKLDLFYSGELVFVRSRVSDLHTLREVSITTHRAGLQTNYLRVLCGSYFIRLLELVAEPETPIEPLHDLLRRALDYLATRDPDLRGVLHFESQLATLLGLEPPPGGSPVQAIRQHAHTIPDQRGKLLAALKTLGAP